MDLNRTVKNVLYNLPVAGDVDTSTFAGFLKLPYLPKIDLTDYLGYELITYAAEVPQVYTIGTSAPTVVAERHYQVAIGNTGNHTNGNNSMLRKFGATAPVTLGANATELHNIYTSLSRQINAARNLYCTAYPIVTLVHATDAGDNLNVGEVVTGATSGATGIIITRTDALNINVAMTSLSTPFVNGENIDDETGSGPYALTAGPTLGIGMRITDDAGYYPATGPRKGKNTVMLTKGFVQATHLVQTTAAVYGFGMGARLLDDVFVREALSDNAAKGQIDFPTNEAPVTAHEYNYMLIKTKKTLDVSAATQINGAAFLDYGIWLDNDAAGYGAFVAAMALL